jgi:hypothetical protein
MSKKHADIVDPSNKVLKVYQTKCYFQPRNGTKIAKKVHGEWMWTLSYLVRKKIWMTMCCRLLGNNTTSWCSVTKVGSCVDDFWK